MDVSQLIIEGWASEETIESLLTRHKVLLDKIAKDKQEVLFIMQNIANKLKPFEFKLESTKIGE